MQIVTKPIFYEGILFCLSPKSLKYYILTIVKQCALITIILKILQANTNTSE